MGTAKKLDKHKYKQYPPIKLYLDDIEKLIEVFELNNIPYTITVNEEYAYEKLTDLEENDNPTMIKSFKIISNQPFVSVEFKKNNASLYTASDNIESTGLFNKLNDIISKQKKRPSILYNRKLGWIIFALSLPLNFFIFYTKMDKKSVGFITVPFIILFIILCYYNINQQIKNYSTVYMVKKDSQPNFFIRNKDQIKLVLIGAVIGALLYYITEYYIFHRKPTSQVNMNCPLLCPPKIKMQ